MGLKGLLASNCQPTTTRTFNRLSFNVNRRPRRYECKSVSASNEKENNRQQTIFLESHWTSTSKSDECRTQLRHRIRQRERHKTIHLMSETMCVLHFGAFLSLSIYISLVHFFISCKTTTSNDQSIAGNVSTPQVSFLSPFELEGHHYKLSSWINQLH